jgi:phage-related protein
MVANFRLQVVFYKSDSGKEPVRDWLKKLDKEDRKVIGEDIKTVQFGWPLGMPLVRKIEKGLWEVRIQKFVSSWISESHAFYSPLMKV